MRGDESELTLMRQNIFFFFFFDSVKGIQEDSILVRAEKMVAISQALLTMVTCE